MKSTPSDWPMANTQHGMVVALGECLKQHGVIDRWMGVTIQQKTRRFAPQIKRVEFLAGILRGGEYRQDLKEGPHPLAQDTVVARAWGQPGFAHSSTVSRTWDTCDEQTVKAVARVIPEFSRPFIATAVHEVLRRGAPIGYDFDLTGQAVSSTSTTDEDGWRAFKSRCSALAWPPTLCAGVHPGCTVARPRPRTQGSARWSVPSIGCASPPTRRRGSKIPTAGWLCNSRRRVPFRVSLCSCGAFRLFSSLWASTSRTELNPDERFAVWLRNTYAR